MCLKMHMCKYADICKFVGICKKHAKNMHEYAVAAQVMSFCINMKNYEKNMQKYSRYVSMKFICKYVSYVAPHPHLANGASGLCYVTFVIQHVIYD